MFTRNVQTFAYSHPIHVKNNLCCKRLLSIYYLMPRAFAVVTQTASHGVVIKVI